jgi:hypothetical protein
MHPHPHLPHGRTVCSHVLLKHAAELDFAELLVQSSLNVLSATARRPPNLHGGARDMPLDYYSSSLGNDAAALIWELIRSAMFCLEQMAAAKQAAALPESRVRSSYHKTLLRTIRTHSVTRPLSRTHTQRLPLPRPDTWPLALPHSVTSRPDTWPLPLPHSVTRPLHAAQLVRGTHLIALHSSACPAVSRHAVPVLPMLQHAGCSVVCARPAQSAHAAHAWRTAVCSRNACRGEEVHAHRASVAVAACRCRSRCGADGCSG